MAQLWVKIDDVELTHGDKVILMKEGNSMTDIYKCSAKITEDTTSHLERLCLTLLAASQKLPPHRVHAFLCEAITRLFCPHLDVALLKSTYITPSAPIRILAAISG